MNKYYNGVKLLSLNDINGNKPEIYICTTNRTGGKTTFYNRMCVKKYLNGQGKFGLLYRYNYELNDVADKFFNDIGNLFFKEYKMKSERKARGIYVELFISKKNEDNYKSCGYALALNNADQIKKLSHLLSDTNRMIFDEFQSETNHYCNNEIQKFLSIHTSLARGNGEQVKYLPVYMLSNAVSLLNPYYIEMGISTRLKNDTKYLKGDGFVLEQGFIESASVAQKTSGFNKAFATSNYVAYASENIYLNDNTAFIIKPDGKSKYLATLKYNNKDYSVKEFADNGIIYCDDSVDSTFPLKIAITSNDHNVNYVMLKKHSMFLNLMKYYFENGCFRFKDLNCKEVILKALSY